MSVSNYKTVALNDFNGPWLRQEVTDVVVPNGLLSLNAEYNPGNVATRYGFQSVYDPGVNISSMSNWIRGYDGYFPTTSFLTYLNSATGAVSLVADVTNPLGTTTTLFTQAGSVGAVFSGGSTRMYITAFDANMQGTTQCRIVGTYGSAVNTDRAFLGPLTAKPSLSEGGAGEITGGRHRIGYVITTRNGFTGKVSPVTNEDFDPTSSIVASGSKTIEFSLPATWPTEAATVYPVMTPASNLNRYFIPPSLSMGVPGGSNFTVTFTLNISDDDLMAQGLEITDNQNLLTQATDGTGPFKPFFVLLYGQRVVYFTDTTYYISEPADAQQITADQHVRYLPNLKTVRSAFVLNNLLYVLGPNWTYSESDNLEKPAAWSAPELVDGQIGTLSPAGATVSASGTFAWVAHTTGLYVFNGKYAARPISYNVDPDWRRINWLAASRVQVVDNRDKQQAYVLVPLDGANAPTHLMLFDYSNGLTPELVKYSLWSLKNYAPGAIALVQHPTTKRQELWLAGSGAKTKILRQTNDADANPFNDDGEAIDWQYETCLLPGMAQQPGMVWRHYAFHLRVTGAGTLSAVCYGIDRTKNFTPATIAIASTAGADPYRRIALNSEGMSYRFRVNAVNQHVVLSALKHYFNAGPTFR